MVRRLGIALSLLVTLASPAAAQAVPPRLAVSFGLGQVRPLATDGPVPFLPPSRPVRAFAWMASLQKRATTHLLVEGVVSSWSDADPRVAAFGSVESPGSLDVTIEQATRAFLLNLIATTAFGRLRVSSGAGIGYSFISVRIAGVQTDCPLPQDCRFDQREAFTAFSIEGALGTEVRLTSRLQAFVTYRLVLPFREGFAEVSLLGGVKVTLR